MGYLISLETEVRRLVEDYLSCPQTLVMVNLYKVSSSPPDLIIEVWLYSSDWNYNRCYRRMISSEDREKRIDSLAYEILLDLVYGS
jgi:hypothetical protein